MARFLNVKAVREACKENGRRVGKDFLSLLDEHIQESLRLACEVHNGGKKTLGADVAGYVGLKTRRKE